MRAALLIAGALALGACAEGPTAPSRAIPPPLHHNIPATLEDGTLVWVCETQPRQYTGAGGSTWERDHYIQATRCPEVPIR